MCPEGCAEQRAVDAARHEKRKLGAILDFTGGRVDRWGVSEELQVDGAVVEVVGENTTAKSIRLRVDKGV